MGDESYDGHHRADTDYVLTDRMPLSILDDLDDDYRITIFKVGGDAQSRGFERSASKHKNDSKDPILAHSNYRVTMDKQRAQIAI
jgi:hypothetical protein